MCLTFWNGASLWGPQQHQLAKGLSFWAGERCPTEGSKQTEELNAYARSAHLPINLPIPTEGRVLQVKLSVCQRAVEAQAASQLRL